MGKYINHGLQEEGNGQSRYGGVLEGGAFFRVPFFRFKKGKKGRHFVRITSLIGGHLEGCESSRNSSPDCRLYDGISRIGNGYLPAEWRLLQVGCHCLFSFLEHYNTIGLKKAGGYPKGAKIVF